MLISVDDFYIYANGLVVGVVNYYANTMRHALSSVLVVFNNRAIVRVYVRKDAPAGIVLHHMSPGYVANSFFF